MRHVIIGNSAAAVGAIEALRQHDLPLLLLEGDCSLRSLGQQRTRIEAFVEMLGRR